MQGGDKMNITQAFPYEMARTRLCPSKYGMLLLGSGRRGGIMVSALNSGSSGLGSSPGREHCVFLGVGGQPCNGLASHPVGSRYTPCPASETRISSGLLGHLACIQTLHLTWPSPWMFSPKKVNTSLVLCSHHFPKVPYNVSPLQPVVVVVFQFVYKVVCLPFMNMDCKGEVFTVARCDIVNLLTFYWYL